MTLPNKKLHYDFTLVLGNVSLATAFCLTVDCSSRQSQRQMGAEVQNDVRHGQYPPTSLRGNIRLTSREA